MYTFTKRGLRAVFLFWKSAILSRRSVSENQSITKKGNSTDCQVHYFLFSFPFFPRLFLAPFPFSPFCGTKREISKKEKNKKQLLLLLSPQTSSSPKIVEEEDEEEEEEKKGIGRNHKPM